MTEQMAGTCATITSKWFLHFYSKWFITVFTFLIHISTEIFTEIFVILLLFFRVFMLLFLCAFFLHIGISAIGLSLWVNLSKREGSYTYS